MEPTTVLKTATVLLALRSRSLLRIAVWIPVVFAAILLHELGHAFMARRYKQAPRIELHAMGGDVRIPRSDRVRDEIGDLALIAVDEKHRDVDDKLVDLVQEIRILEDRFTEGVEPAGGHSPAARRGAAAGLDLDCGGGGHRQVARLFVVVVGGPFNSPSSGDSCSSRRDVKIGKTMT